MDNIVCGFSGNAAEHLHLDGGVGDKLVVEREDLRIEGSTVNVCFALRHFGFVGGITAMILVGGKPDLDAGRLLFNRLIGRLVKQRVRVSPLEVLDRCNRARVLVRPHGSSDHKILGTKGCVMPRLVAPALEVVREEISGAGVAIMTSLRPQEMPFAKLVHSTLGSKTIFSLHGDTLRAPAKTLNAFLKMGVVMVMNQDEFEVLEDRGVNFANIHHPTNGSKVEKGPELIVVTNGERNGLFSLRGRVGTFSVKSVKSKCTDGAGDRLIAQLAIHLAKGERVLASAKSCEAVLASAAERVRHTLR